LRKTPGVHRCSDDAAERPLRDDVDKRKRIHSSLGDLTPAEFEQQWLRGQRAIALP
jgi:transposase InsO family protein